MKVLIDSNIPMDVAGTEHPNRESVRCLLAQVQAGEIEGYTGTDAGFDHITGIRRLDFSSAPIR